MATETQVALKGTETQRELGARALEVMKRKGMLFGANAPIRMNLQSIAAALTKPGGPLAGADSSALITDLRAALLQNGEVFAAEANDEFVTTKGGRAYHTGGGENIHTFKDRLNPGATSLDLEKAKEYEASIIDLAASRAEKQYMLEDEEDDDEEDLAPAPSRIQLPTQALPRNLENSTIIPAHLIPEPLRPIVPEPKEEPPIESVPASASASAPASQAQPQQPQRPQETPITPPAQPGQATQAPTTPAKRAEEETPRKPAAATTPPTTPGPGAASQPRVTPAQPVEQPAIASEPPKTPAVSPVAPAASAAAPAGYAIQPSSSPVTSSTPSIPAPGTPAQPLQRPAEPAAPVKRPQAPAPPPTPVAPVITGPVEVAIQTESGAVTVDLRDPVDEILLDDAVAEALERMISSTVAEDARMVHFGSEMFPEEAVQRFSKGDFRRIKEYLDEPETEGFASDHNITTDVLNRRVDFPDYERLRFSVNYRMLKEKKDFEFVGVDSDRLWISAGTSPVPPPARKPADIGQDYRFLEDPAIASIEEEDSTQVTKTIQYSLTYYEYENGVLPYDHRFKRVFSGAVFEDQRSSLIRIEIPQLYAAIVGELRYPAGNRGGFIMGLRDLFVEHLVPGAKFTLVPTDRGEDIFEVHFNRADEQEVNLLQFDDRKGRYVFRPVSFAVETDPTMLPTQERFGKLHNHKKLEESERKRPDAVIANAFDLIGEQNDGKLWANFDDLYAVVNIERPVSRPWLRTLLSGPYPSFYPDETTKDAYFYDAGR